MDSEEKKKRPLWQTILIVIVILVILAVVIIKTLEARSFVEQIRMVEFGGEVEKSGEIPTADVIVTYSDITPTTTLTPTTTETPTPTVTQTPAPTPTPKSTPSGNFNEPVRLGALEYTFKEMALFEEIGTGILKTEADGIYLVLLVEIKNVGKESVMLAVNDIKIEDSEENVYNPDLGAAVYMGADYALTFKRLNPNLTTSGFVAFDIPRDPDFEATIVIRDGTFFSSEKAYVQLGEIYTSVPQPTPSQTPTPTPKPAQSSFSNLEEVYANANPTGNKVQLYGIAFRIHGVSMDDFFLFTDDERVMKNPEYIKYYGAEHTITVYNTHKEWCNMQSLVNISGEVVPCERSSDGKYCINADSIEIVVGFVDPY